VPIDTVAANPEDSSEPVPIDAAAEDQPAGAGSGDGIGSLLMTSALQDLAESVADIGAACGVQEDIIIDHDTVEKIDIVLAAFDENGDGHLDFAESFGRIRNNL